MVAPLIEAIPPSLYGGTERVVSALTEELVRRGHDVTLFASGDSATKAELVACRPRSLRLSGDGFLANAATLCELAEAYARADEFDLIHNHVDWLAFPFARLMGCPTVTTTHGRLDLPEIVSTYSLFPEQSLVSISEAQRRSLPTANWEGTVHNGVDIEKLKFRPDPGKYLVFLGRFSPEKRPDRAIKVAESVGMRLVLAAKVDPADREYYEEVVAPLIHDSSYAEYIGEVNDREKDELLGGAFACLFPVDWPEPFGLTMVEAMATGTPVVAWHCGSVAEVVRDGTTGFVCESLEDMASALGHVTDLNRSDCRSHVEQHFSVKAMADGYERVYRMRLEHLGVSAQPCLVNRQSAERRALNYQQSLLEHRRGLLRSG
ncbi:MAG TPA: glycosyltransferase family 4 protein [Dehalococcoidia bacterium]|nr:glycosyltransferase family 4 protein [Dehalococcoidia bacterium]